MAAQLGPIASEILRRIMELSCAAGGEILKFHLSMGGGCHASKWAARQVVRQMRNSSETSGNKKKRHKTNSVADVQQTVPLAFEFIKFYPV